MIWGHDMGTDNMLTVNQAGLVANLGIVMGKKCGVKDAEIDPATTNAGCRSGIVIGRARSSAPSSNAVSSR